MGNISFIGAGKLAGNLIRGLTEHGFDTSSLAVADRVPAQTKTLAARHPGLAVHASNQAAADCDVLIACVKPEDLREVCRNIAEPLQARAAVFVSVAAGATLEILAKWTSRTLPTVRCMPNTPVAVGCGMTVLCANASVSRTQRETVEYIFASVGEVAWIENEAVMDLVTALSGSGPAYFFRVIESLAQAATALGMDAAMANKLAVQTALGAATLAQHSENDVATLRAAVTSKGGTTERALAALDQNGVDQMFERALSAAAARSREISATLDSDKSKCNPALHKMFCCF